MSLYCILIHTKLNSASSLHQHQHVSPHCILPWLSAELWGSHGGSVSAVSLMAAAVSLLLLCDWSYVTPAWMRSHKCVQGFRMCHGAILRRQGMGDCKGQTLDVTETHIAINLSGCHIHPHSKWRERQISKNVLAQVGLMYFSHRQVLTCQLHF